MVAQRASGDFGGSLRAARERRGLSLRQIANATKISMITLEALERNDIARLPGGIFTRAFVRSYALEVGLDGAVNVEVLGGRPVAGIGGHGDFCAAAARSDGGLSIIALTATRRGRSTIVPTVEHVSTPGDHVHLVVTEHGVADLRDTDAEERRRRLVAIAAPEFRAGLADG